MRALRFSDRTVTARQNTGLGWSEKSGGRRGGSGKRQGEGDRRRGERGGAYTCGWGPQDRRDDSQSVVVGPDVCEHQLGGPGRALGDVSGGVGVSVEGDGGLLCDLCDFTDHDFVEGVDEGEVRGVHDDAVVLECYYGGGQHLDHIREVWFTLLGHNKNPMRKVDQATVESVELQAPWALTLDAKTLRGQVLGGDIFDCFHEQDRVQIWSRLQAVDGLIPSLFTLFENVKYLKSTPIA